MIRAFYKKNIDSIKETSASSGLAKHLGPMDLIMMGLGSIIGVGAFVTTGMVAAKYAGPAVTLSYAIGGLVCIFVALAYAELAVMIPTSGSVYTYSYVAYGELFAWITGGIMFLEMGLGAASVAAGWSAYVQGLMVQTGITIPDILGKVPSQGGFCDLLAIMMAGFAGLVVYLGTKDSKRLNTILVIIKFVAIIAFVVAASPHFESKNWSDFMPFGFHGVLGGASISFFSFCGFGVIATAAEECKNPKRDVTIGVIGALILSTLVYVVLGGLVTGLVPYTELDNAQPLAYALNKKGSQIGSIIVAVGAICGMTTVLMMQLYGLSRIVYVISRDGMLPSSLSQLHPKYGSPHKTIIILTILIALIAGFMSFDTIIRLSSMASLMDYACVTSIVLYLRFKMPELQRHFQCPAVFIIAPIALMACIYLLFIQVVDKNGQLMLTGKILISWFVVMIPLYFLKPRNDT